MPRGAVIISPWAACRRSGRGDCQRARSRWREGRGLERLHPHNWPLPYDEATNPLSIDLTAANTFILICSSVDDGPALSARSSAATRSEAHALSPRHRADRLFFLGVQVYEYYQLMFGHHYPPASAPPAISGPMREPVRLVLLHDDRLPRSPRRRWRRHADLHPDPARSSASSPPKHHSPVELVGLYWHFVDLVWIILFTVVYLI